LGAITGAAAVSTVIDLEGALGAGFNLVGVGAVFSVTVVAMGAGVLGVSVFSVVGATGTPSAIRRFTVIDGGGGFIAVGGAEGAFKDGSGSAGGSSNDAFVDGCGKGFSGGGANRSTLLLIGDLSIRLYTFLFRCGTFSPPGL